MSHKPSARVEAAALLSMAVSGEGAIMIAAGPRLLTTWAEGARGERGTQCLETDWENITFLELYLLPPPPLPPPYTHVIYCHLRDTHTHTHTHTHSCIHSWDSPACAWVWWAVCSGRSSCGTARRRCTGSVRCCHVSTGAWRWLRSSHTRGPLMENTQRHLWSLMAGIQIPLHVLIACIVTKLLNIYMKMLIFWVQLMHTCVDMCFSVEL